MRRVETLDLFLFDELEVAVEVVEHAEVAGDVDEDDGDEDHDDNYSQAGAGG